MLGSGHDADDAVQETLLRAWRALPRFRGNSSLGSWLYRIATNVCLDALGRRRRGPLPVEYGPSLALARGDAGQLRTGGGWIEPQDTTREIDDRAGAPHARYERREALELAFVVSLRHLPPRQRAALVLREVLGFSAEEAAASLGTTVASVNSALQRARAAVEERLPHQGQQATLRVPPDRRMRETAERFADALERGDVERILALLTADPHVRKAADQRRRARTARNIARLRDRCDLRTSSG